MGYNHQYSLVFDDQEPGFPYQDPLGQSIAWNDQKPNENQVGQVAKQPENSHETPSEESFWSWFSSSKGPFMASISKLPATLDGDMSWAVADGL